MVLKSTCAQAGFTYFHEKLAFLVKAVTVVGNFPGIRHVRAILIAAAGFFEWGKHAVQIAVGLKAAINGAVNGANMFFQQLSKTYLAMCAVIQTALFAIANWNVVVAAWRFIIRAPIAPAAPTQKDAWEWASAAFDYPGGVLPWVIAYYACTFLGGREIGIANGFVVCCMLMTLLRASLSRVVNFTLHLPVRPVPHPGTSVDSSSVCLHPDLLDVDHLCLTPRYFGLVKAGTSKFYVFRLL